MVGNCTYNIHKGYTLNAGVDFDEDTLRKEELFRNISFAIAENIIRQGKELNLDGAWLVTPAADSIYYVAPGTTPSPIVQPLQTSISQGGENESLNVFM
jgi:hypothetical protein